jgi:hypothetical protein
MGQESGVDGGYGIINVGWVETEITYTLEI